MNRRDRSDGIQSGFAGADADRFFDVGDENLAVADPPGLGSPPDRLNGFVEQIIAENNLDLHLGQEIHDVLGSAVEFRMTLLPAKALGFGDGNALQTDLLQSFFHLVELERLDDGLDFFHRAMRSQAVPGHVREAEPAIAGPVPSQCRVRSQIAVVCETRAVRRHRGGLPPDQCLCKLHSYYAETISVESLESVRAAQWPNFGYEGARSGNPSRA